MILKAEGKKARKQKGNFPVMNVFKRYVHNQQWLIYMYCGGFRSHVNGKCGI